jgi:L-fuconolactonase
MQVFGPHRVVFGTDWPVCTLVADAVEVRDATRSLLLEVVGQDEVDAVMDGNARRVYGLA